MGKKKATSATASVATKATAATTASRMWQQRLQVIACILISRQAKWVATIHV